MDDIEKKKSLFAPLEADDVEIDLRKKTDEEKKQLVESARTESKIYRFSKISVRNVKGNKDIIYMILVIASAFAIGYMYCRINLGMTIAEIKVELSNFVEVAIAFVVCLVTAITKLIAKKGLIAEYLLEKFEDWSKDVNKKDVNKIGLTIRPKD